MCSTGQIDAIDAIRELLDVPSVHAIGYCVAGTTLAATLAYLHANGEQDKVKSATFLTAQVDFTEAGDLKLFTGPEVIGLLEELAKDKGYLDGRYMAATFNLLRGRDLIWNYVVNNYLLGEEPPPFDLLYWNSDTTNLPAAWHRDYLEDALRGEQAGREGRDRGCRNADRHGYRSKTPPMCRPGARIISRRRKACGRSWTISRAETVRARRLGAYRRRGEPAGGAEVSILDQRSAVRRRSSRSSTAPRSTRAAGGRTGSSGSRRRTARR